MAEARERYGRTIGRYVLYDEIGAGGMATVHLGRLLGSSGFTRTVAIKRLHPHCARDPQFTRLFLDEANLTARIQHPNVAAMLDVVSTDNELLLVMEYIHGEPLSRLLGLARDAGEHVAPRIAVAILIDVLRGLHAAHEAKTEMGERLDIIHRDVTPQNVLVGVDGVTRLVDFGVAKAASRLQVTGEGQVKGKFAYMPPEQLQGYAIDRRVDVYAAAVVLWETLTGRRLFTANNPGNVVTRVLEMVVEPPSTYVKEIPKALDDVVMRGLSRDVAARYATAEEMAHALEEKVAPATVREVSQWVRSIATEQMSLRAQLLSSIESMPLPTEATPELATPPSSPSGPTPDPNHSQISTISLTMATPRAKPRRIAALVASGLAALALAGVIIWRTSPRASVSAAPSQPSAPPSIAPPSVVQADSATTFVLPVVSAVSTRPPKPVVHTQAAASSKPNCNPPYTVDAKDPRIHVAKPECM